MPRKKDKAPDAKDRDLRYGQALGAYRESRGLTQEELARRLGMSLSGYRNYEGGRVTLSVEHFDRFAAALGVSRAELVAALGVSEADPDAERRARADRVIARVGEDRLDWLERIVAQIPDDEPIEIVEDVVRFTLAIRKRDNPGRARRN